IKEGFNIEPVELVKEHIIVLRAKDHQPAASKPLTTGQATITSMLKSNKAQAEAKLLANKLYEQINQGNSPVGLAKDNNSQWINKGLVGRTETSKVPASILQKAFTLPKDNATVYATTTTNTGDSVVLAINRIEEGSASEITAEQRAQAAQQAGRTTYTSLIEYLKKQADIVRNYELLN
ncbi:MAG: hypothetical protein HUJ30_05140, partial [Gammaproteobacteria bacterium]|nr:hypothetical protein [Gammaproteobacteria bacterium]